MVASAQLIHSPAMRDASIFKPQYLKGVGEEFPPWYSRNESN